MYACSCIILWYFNVPQSMCIAGHERMLFPREGGTSRIGVESVGQSGQALHAGRSWPKQQISIFTCNMQ